MRVGCARGPGWRTRRSSRCSVSQSMCQVNTASRPPILRYANVGCAYLSEPHSNDIVCWAGVGPALFQQTDPNIQCLLLPGRRLGGRRWRVEAGYDRVLHHQCDSPLHARPSEHTRLTAPCQLTMLPSSFVMIPTHAKAEMSGTPSGSSTLWRSASTPRPFYACQLRSSMKNLS